MRTTWKGSISFGLVNVPVGLAVSADTKDVSFKLLHTECGAPIKLKKSCPGCEAADLAADQIERGFEVSKNTFIKVADEHLENCVPEASRAIEITDFVEADEIDALLVKDTHYLVPEEGKAARKTYRLLLDALAESQTVAIGKYVKSGKEYLCAIRARGVTLVVHQLYFAEDVRSAVEIEEAMAEVETSEQERAMALTLVAQLRSEFNHAAYANEHRDRVRDMLGALAEGEEPVAPVKDEPEADTTDLLAALQASVVATAAPAAKVKKAAKPAAKPAQKKVAA